MVENQTKQNTFWLWSDKLDWAKRGDVFYWLPNFLSIENTVKKGVKLQDILTKNITYGHTPLGGKSNYTDKGVLFIRSGQLNDFFLDLSDNVYISENEHKKMQRSIIKGRDVLVATVGATIGAVAITPEDIKEANCNQAVAILRSDESKVNPYFLAIYLSLPYGKEQILRQSSGGARDNLDPFELKQIRVILPTIKLQQNAELFTKEAYKLKKEAESDYQKTVQLLNQSLGVSDIKKRRVSAFWFWSDEIDIVSKLHPAAYKKSEIKGVKDFVKMKNYAESLDYGTSEDLTYQSSVIPFLRITDIDEHFQINEAEVKYISQFDAEKLSKYKVGLNDLLISRTGTLGDAVLIDKDLKDSIFGSYFIRIKFNKKIEEKLNLEYLTFFINSTVGKEQSSSLSSGGVQTNLTIQAIENMKVPVIKKDIQNQIVKYLQSFKEKNRLSKQKLQEAKDFVENLITK